MAIKFLFNPFTGNFDSISLEVPGGSGSELQIRATATTFGAVTGSSYSGTTLTLASNNTFKVGSLTMTGLTYTSSGTTIFGATGSAVVTAPTNVYLRPASSLLMDTGTDATFTISGTFTVTNNGNTVFTSQGNIQLFATQGAYLNSGAGYGTYITGDTAVSISNNIGGGTIYLSDDGSISLRAISNTGGIYADALGNTYVGYYAGGLSTNFDIDGKVTVPYTLAVGDPAIGAQGSIFLGYDFGYATISRGDGSITFDTPIFINNPSGSPQSTIDIFKSGGQTSALFSVGIASTGDLFNIDASGNVVATQTMSVSGNVGVGGGNPAAGKLAIGSGSATVPALRFNSATIITSPLSGAMEWDANRLYFTTSTGTTRKLFQLNTYRAIAALRTLDGSDDVVDCTSGTFTVTLPTAVGVAGIEYTVKNSGAGTITLATTSSQTIDGVTTKTIAAAAVLTVRSTGANWIII